MDKAITIARIEGGRREAGSIGTVTDCFRGHIPCALADDRERLWTETPDPSLHATANYNRDKWVFKAGSLAALGRTAEAKSWVEQALKVFPDLNAELMNNDPGYNEAEHRRLVETMRLAGFPLCLTKEQLDKFEKPRRLPECQKS
ncbi:hypothetical protein [Sinorhizobium psoraleae]|uniref:Uncharacterized protein n=1 Tax=Sinorhizobium psoraleae TaxID=520838 RepID=A0ABT4KJU7_9HYPH|nr:hypothetical protein [Sinorhizobium psoraleae]MCZ4092242.1 hypothetical protein [Sinorhizobium psoraleae]